MGAKIDTALKWRPIITEGIPSVIIGLIFIGLGINGIRVNYQLSKVPKIEEPSNAELPMKKKQEHSYAMPILMIILGFLFGAYGVFIIEMSRRGGDARLLANLLA